MGYCLQNGFFEKDFRRYGLLLAQDFSCWNFHNDFTELFLDFFVVNTHICENDNIILVNNFE